MDRTNLPPFDISIVNFENIDEINAFATHLLNVGNDLGILSAPTPLQSVEANAIYQAAKRWVGRVKPLLLTLDPADSLRLLESYELLHAVAYRRPPERDTLNRIALAAFAAMLRGDTRVDQYIMFRTIRKAVRQRDPLYFDKPLRWSCIVLERWHGEATEGFDPTILSDYDITSRINILLESDLYAYEGRNQTRFKQNLLDRYRPSLAI